MAAAWMIWRTEDAVRKACPDANGYAANQTLFDVFARACDDDFAPTALMQGSAAQIQFWAAMLGARINAAGMRPGAAARVPIAADEWQTFDYFPVGRGAPDAIGSYAETAYGCVVVLRKEVMATWPALEPTDDTASTNVTSSIRDESECKKWLIGLFSQSPTIRTQSNKGLFSEAKSKWPQIGNNQFSRAKREAVRDAKTPAWGHAGRPKAKI
jgi:hypothetical protein